MKNNKIIKIVMLIIVMSLFIYLHIKDNEGNTNNERNLNYEVINDEDIIESLNIGNINNRGYKIIEKNNDYYLIINNGMTLSCCGRLWEKNITADGNNIKVAVEYGDICDCLPDHETYSKVVIKLNQRPNNIDINNKTYKEIK
jgi:hypothetical protein